MIHELTLSAVERKLYDFDHVPRFINANEIACALGIGLKQAGLPLPELTPGESVTDMLARETPPVLASPQTDDRVKEALSSYYKPGETVTKNTAVILKLGYEARLPH